MPPALVWNDAHITLGCLYLVYTLKTLCESIYKIKVDKTRARFLQIGTCFMTCTYFICKELIYAHIPIEGCGVMKYMTGVVIYYLAFLGHYYFQFIKLHALLVSCYSYYTPIINVAAITTYILYFGSTIGYGLMAQVNYDSNCGIIYNGAFFDIIGLCFAEMFVLMSNFAIYLKLSKTEDDGQDQFLIPFLKMEQKFLYTSMWSAVFFISTAIVIVLPMVSNSSTQVLYMTQIAAIAYFSSFTANNLQKTKKAYMLKMSEGGLSCSNTSRVHTGISMMV